jgi:CRP-like cAMP-binding protein
MPLDWFSKAGSSDSVADLIERKKYKKALEKLREQFEKGNRSVGLRLQYAQVLARSGEDKLAIPILLGLASELHAAGAQERAHDVLQQAERLSPGRGDIAAKRRAFFAAERRQQRQATPQTAPHPPETASAPPTPEVPEVTASSETVTENDAVDLFAEAMAPTSLQAPAPSEAQVAAALASAEAAIASEVWVDVEGEAGAEVLVAQVASAPSIADVAEMAVAEGHSSKGSLIAYVFELAARLPIPADERPGPAHLAAVLFGGLGEDELRELLSGLRRRDFDPGSTMVAEGDRGGSLFILARGRAKVLVTGLHGRSFEVAELDEGAFFGEISMVGGRRMATVVAVGPCETLEIAPAALETLARRHPLAQEIVEETLLERANSLETAAVRAIPRMDSDTPTRALGLLEAHFGLKSWNPKTRLRLAELLAKTGRYLDAVPVLVGLADQMQAAGQPARALAVLKKIPVIAARDPEDLRIAPLTREPAARREAPPSAVLTYVSAGRPAPSAKAAQHFQVWLEELMREARDETVATGESPLLGVDTEDLLGAIDFNQLAAKTTVKAAPSAQDARKAAKASSNRRAKASGLSNMR